MDHVEVLRLPRLFDVSVSEYSEVFFDEGYKVLRGAIVGDFESRRSKHVPELGPRRAEADLLGIRLAWDVD